MFIYMYVCMYVCMHRGGGAPSSTRCRSVWSAITSQRKEATTRRSAGSRKAKKWQWDPTSMAQQEGVVAAATNKAGCLSTCFATHIS